MAAVTPKKKNHSSSHSIEIRRMNCSKKNLPLFVLPRSKLYTPDSHTNSLALNSNTTIGPRRAPGRLQGHAREERQLLPRWHG